MSDDTWLDNNNRYLEASLHWLRLRLGRLLPPEPPQPAAPPAPSAAPGEAALTEPAAAAGPGRRFWSRRPGLADPLAAPVLLTTSSGTPAGADGLLAAAVAEREAAAGCDPAPALVLLAQRLDLSPFERDTLLLCAAMEYEPALGALCARIHGSPARSFPSFSLALSAFDQPAWDAISAQRPLRYAHLVEPDQNGALPLTACALRADERIVHYLKGLNALDERLATLLVPAADDPPQLAASQQASVDAIMERLRLAAQDSTLPVVQLAGADSASRLAVARQVCASLGRRLYRLETDRLPSQTADIELLARLWQRESILLPIALYIDAADIDANGAEAAALRRFLAREMGVSFLAVGETPLALAAPAMPVEVGRPSGQEQFEAWLAQLPDAGDDPALAARKRATAQRLAGQFSLNHDQIRTAGALAVRLPAAGELGDRLWDASRELLRPRLDALAQRLEAKAGWDDLVLPDEQMRIMRQIAGQVRERYRVYAEWGFGKRMNRGFGISALFAGESGTGKTMGAEVIANDLRLNLYRIDLSAVVSKYIGETEKNLRRLFDAAEQGGAILFFDEADALFGKRSEVKDIHDRYANIEINYLLQRMESFSGLAILATNMKTALDPAFMRRLRFIVNFPFPGLKERSEIWKKALPAETPAEAIDYERLARLNISGGNIHSIALNAAFMAAQDSGVVSMPLMLAAARGEMKKLDKPLSEAEFR
jgi:predicted nucleic acid-binding protein